MLEIRVFQVLGDLVANVQYVPSRQDSDGFIPREVLPIGYGTYEWPHGDNVADLADLVSHLIESSEERLGNAGGWSLLV